MANNITWTYITNAANSGSTTITIPATAAVGDLAILFDFAWSGSTSVTEVVPTNWTKISGVVVTVGDRSRGTISYRVLQSGEPGSSVTGQTSSGGPNGRSKVMLIFRPDATIKTLTIGSNNAENTGSDPSSQAVSAATYSIILGAKGSREGVPSWTTESPAFAATVSQTYLAAAYTVYAGSSAGHTVDIGDSGKTNYLASFRIDAETYPILAVGTGSFSLSGQAVSLKQGYAVAAGAGSFSLSGQAVGLQHGRNLAVGAGSYSLAGQDVTLTYTPASNPVLAVEAGEFTLSGQDVALVATLGSLIVGTGTFALTGQDVGTYIGRNLAAGYGAFTLTGQDISLMRGLNLAVGAGSFALTGQDVTLTKLSHYAMEAGCGVFVLTGQDVALIYTPGIIIVVPALTNLSQITAALAAQTSITTDPTSAATITRNRSFRITH